jgi:rhodanese-related sulfurtransferase
MPRDIDREQVRELVAQGAQLVEVMPAEEYEQEHLPGALSIPLESLTPAKVQRLARDRSLIVYCYDQQ